jgi:sugar (glycoside-pentoside-hexuronide) transporter
MNEQNGKIKKSLFLAWPTKTISLAVGSVLFGSITYYATDVMHLSAATVGIIFMLSKILDGITDVIAGFMMDKLNLKGGKGRPYEWGVVGFWLTLLLMFSAPEMGINLSYAYLFVMYALNVSVFYTLLSCNENVYLANVLERSEQSVSLLSVANIIAMLVTIVASMVFPQLIAAAGTDRSAWRQFVLVISIPMAIFGMIRYFTVKERPQKPVASESAAQKFTLKDMFLLLKHNKYILIFSWVIFLANFGTNFTNATSTYYYKYVMGDIGIGSIMSLAMLSMVIAIAVSPVLSKKTGLTNVMRIYTIIGIIGYLLRLLSPASIPLVLVSNILANIGYYPMFALTGKFIIDCIDYGEWKTGRRSEGTVSCAQSVTAKLGNALAVGGVGITMAMSGYNGSAEVQGSSAVTMIVMQASVIPAVFLVIQFIVLKIYDLDKLLPQIKADLGRKDEATPQ